jgi:hypothetical protein
MPFDVLNPIAACAYWGSFAPNLEGGAVRVPIPDSGGALRSEPLNPSNASSFATCALGCVLRIQNEPLRVLAFGAEEGQPSWRLEKLPKKAGIVASSSDGRRVRILSSLVSAEAKSLKAEIGTCGLSGRAHVRQSVTVDARNCHLVAVYEMRFSGAMLRGLRDFLGISRLEPLTQVVAEGFRLLGLGQAETMDLTETPRRKGRLLEWSAAGISAAGQGVVGIWSRPDGVPEGVREELGLYVHASRENNAFPPAAIGLWNFIADWSARHDRKEKSVV